jgi:hypothetical protein
MKTAAAETVIRSLDTQQTSTSAKFWRFHFLGKARLSAIDGAMFPHLTARH